jgi:hypothetical protein
MPAVYTRPQGGGAIAAFPCELLKNGSRTNAVDTVDVNRERSELEAPFPRLVIFHPEQLLYGRLSVERGGDVLRLSARVAACPTARADSSKSGLRSTLSNYFLIFSPTDHKKKKHSKQKLPRCSHDSTGDVAGRTVPSLASPRPRRLNNQTEDSP